MNISIIVAMSQNLVIGQKNSIPWNIPKDLSWFKKHTIKKSIIMGRKTWESIGRVLPMRQNIVLTRQKNIKNTNVLFVNSISKAIQSALYKNEIMIIGGSNLYNQMLTSANKLYITHIEKYILGDTYFPTYDHLPWKIIFKKKIIEHEKTKNSFYVTFKILKKIT
ncbi:dihydrofolate reductase [Buchnera aphidicola str. Bp (Baizongia pistaciae)]|uniref:Dihydrofolate reductase n=1 Tax=Buchnera aphidicola subsp. Baizongia pistaciae (strain Bp) TaxID=224915 RepID=DYR_BUCBP|nr:type 3 dihydrofolate reductase [Buchnera aphidicola]Q89AV2.1 RecName: Full=Dihydrofolate reductase [Buchnera aphidicola str. Bp (Baizongia pistaciae)]AAO26867.1 dihydrofolate reductase [Buchnera aphidicola str. Bp (Baizongia pistaciae)]